MNKYLIEHRIKTLSHLSVGLGEGDHVPEMTIGGFSFYHWDYSPVHAWLGDAWLARREIEAPSAAEAIKIFRGDLDKIIQKVGFVSQCYMDFYREPFLINKLENNPNRIFFYRLIKERDGVSLPFDDQELESYHGLVDFPYSEAFRFLQECRNTIGYIPRLVLLFSALEAMCGIVTKEDAKGNPYTTYNKNEMKEILGNDFYNEVFGRNGIRHKLNHGEVVENVFNQDYVDKIYKKIVKYFNDKFNTEIEENVVSPQRHFYDNHEYLDLWLMPEEGFDVGVKNCFESSEEFGVKGCSNAPRNDIKNY